MHLRYLLPGLGFLLLAVGLGVGLTLKPREIPSALIGKPVPEFDLPAVEGRDGRLSSADLRTGTPVLVNVFASWCGPCRQEHPLFMELARTTDFTIFGLNQRDAPDDASRWLEVFGDPYDKTGADLSGRTSIDWGVYGVPETFVVDGSGCIQYKHISVMTRDVLEEEILPRMRGQKHVPCEK
jgi:cytochrome c biogenesis protein CcmG/thiol:disulfide interchange protein DsbE